MPERRVGLVADRCLGGVGTTAALGLAALRRGLTDTTGLVTALPLFAGLDLDAPASSSSAATTSAAATWPQSVAHAGPADRASSTPAVVEACTPGPGGVERERPARHGAQQRRRDRRAGRPPGRAACRHAASGHRAHPGRPARVPRPAPARPGRGRQRRVDRAAVRAAARARGRSSDCKPRSAERTPAILPASSLYAYAALDLGLPVRQLHAVARRVAARRWRSWPRSASVPHRRPGRQDRRDAAEDGAGADVRPPQPARPELGRPQHPRQPRRPGARRPATTRRPRSGPRTRSSRRSSATSRRRTCRSSTSSRWTTGRRRGTTSTSRASSATKMMLQFTWQGCDSLLAAPLVHRPGPAGAARPAARRGRRAARTWRASSRARWASTSTTSSSSSRCWRSTCGRSVDDAIAA